MTSTVRAEAFSQRVVILFATSIVTSGIGIFNGFLFAKLLGPAAKGNYTLLVLLPATVMILVQLGLPKALGFHAARGQVSGMVRKAITLAALLSVLGFGAVLVLMPWLRATFLKGLELPLIIFALSALPLLVITTFTSGTVISLKAVGWYSGVTLAQSAGACVLLLVIIGALGLGVPGAVATYLVTAVIGMVGMWAGAARAAARVERPTRVTYRELFRYGLPLYPGSLTSFFSYRADVFLLAALLPDPSAPLGYYSLGVTLAEMVFFLPNAVGSIFLPHVAGAQREEADRHVLTVSRVTLLLTGLAALALAPIGTILIRVFLPAFVPSLSAFYILLPGVVALGVMKVVSEYISGLGRTATTSAVNVFAFVLNIAANLVLIPPFGFVGAATASLISYSTSAVVITAIAARVAHAPMSGFWIPRVADVRFVVATLAVLVRHALARIPLGRHIHA